MLIAPVVSNYEVKKAIQADDPAECDVFDDTHQENKSRSRRSFATKRTSPAGDPMADEGINDGHQEDKSNALRHTKMSAWHPLLGGIDGESLRHHGGEVAVGLSCGALAAWIVRKVQSVAVTIVIFMSVGTAAALHLGWTTPVQVLCWLVI